MSRPYVLRSLPRASTNSSANYGDEQVQAAMESCVGKSVMSGVMGFGMGGLFGMFMASVRHRPARCCWRNC